MFSHLRIGPEVEAEIRGGAFLAPGRPFQSLAGFAVFLHFAAAFWCFDNGVFIILVFSSAVPDCGPVARKIPAPPCSCASLPSPPAGAGLFLFIAGVCRHPTVSPLPAPARQ